METCIPHFPIIFGNSECRDFQKLIKKNCILELHIKKIKEKLKEVRKLLKENKTDFSQCVE